MISRHSVHNRWNFTLLFVILICVSVSAAVNKDELLEKQEKCKQEMEKMETEIEVAMSKLSDPNIDDKVKMNLEIPELPEECKFEEHATVTGTELSDDEMKNFVYTSKTDPDSFYEMTKRIDVDSLKKALKSEVHGSAIAGLGEQLVKKLGGARKINVTDLEDLGSAAVYSVQPGDYKYLSDEAFKYILDQIYNETRKAALGWFGETMGQEDAEKVEMEGKRTGQDAPGSPEDGINGKGTGQDAPGSPEDGINGKGTGQDAHGSPEDGINGKGTGQDAPGSPEDGINGKGTGQDAPGSPEDGINGKGTARHTRSSPEDGINGKGTKRHTRSSPEDGINGKGTGQDAHGSPEDGINEEKVGETNAIENKLDAETAFAALDTNKNNKVSISEIKDLSVLGVESDEEISDEEAKEKLGDKEEVDLNQFTSDVWPNLESLLSVEDPYEGNQESLVGDVEGPNTGDTHLTAETAFASLDTNKDNKVSISEIKDLSMLGVESDEEISDEEAKEKLGGREEVDLNQFTSDVWPSMESLLSGEDPYEGNQESLVNAGGDVKGTSAGDTHLTAETAFASLDTNKDNKVSISEIKDLSTLGIESDEEVSDEEAKEKLGDREEVDLNQFTSDVWPSLESLVNAVGEVEGPSAGDNNLTAATAFAALDTNKDNMLSISEIKDLSVLGVESDEEISDEEAKGHLGGSEEVDLNQFTSDVWPTMESLLSGEDPYEGNQEFHTEWFEAVNMEAVSTEMLISGDSSRIKALCGRAFRLYRTEKDINSEEGWKRIQFLMFCAPPSVCKRVNNDLIQKDINFLAYQPWTCLDDGETLRLDEEDINDDDYFNWLHMYSNTRRLFPSNKRCGKILAEKLTASETFDVTKNMTSLHSLQFCLPQKVLKKAIDGVNGCAVGEMFIQGGLLNRKMANYVAKKCFATPTEPEEITCTSLEGLKPYLQSMKRSFFKSLPKDVMCDAKCIELFKGEETFPKDVMKHIMKKCFKDNPTITSDDVKNLGGLVTDLPLDKFEQINAADLESNIIAIKKDLQSSKKQRGRKTRKTVMKKLAKKMLDDGKLSNLVDSKEIMKEVSLKDLKSSLSESTDVIKDLGIDNVNGSLGFTNSQKKWVVKQLVKNKEASNFSVDDLREMKSLVTGMLSSHIKKMGQAHSEDTKGMELATEMCTNSDWPRKSLEAINKYLIQKSLGVRDSAVPMSSLTVMDVQGLGCECLLNFNTTEYEDMDTEVCSAVCMKIGYCDIFRCLNPTRRKNILQGCLKCKGLGSHAITDADFDELGPNLISQMSKAQLDLVPAEVLQSHIEFFKDMCMDQTLRQAVSDALQKVIGSSGADFDTDTLYLLGSAMKVLPRSLQQELDKVVVSDLQTGLMEELVPETDEDINLEKCCEKWLDSSDLENLKEQNFNLMLTVKEAFFADTEVTKRKRAAIFNWTCRQIHAIPILFTTASMKELSAMSNSEFLECLEVIGNIKELKSWQQSLLLGKTKTALPKPSVCDMSASELEQLGVIAHAFSTQDINCLPLSVSSVVTSLGDLEGWSTAQLSALASTYLTANSLTDLSTLTSSDITMLGSIMCGFTADQITTISPVEFGESGKEIGSMAECGLQQDSAFVSLAIQADNYGPVNTWDAEDVTELNFITAGLSGDQIKELTTAAIEGLDAEVIPIIPGDVLESMTLSQLRSFSDDQSSAVTDDQRGDLTTAQNEVLDSILGVNEPVIGAGHGHGTSSAPALIRVFGSTAIMVAMTVSVQIFQNL